MTTQEMTKQEMIMNLREKREEKKKAKLKAIVRIVPIDAVENFYITLELSDSIEIGE